MSGGVKNATSKNERPDTPKIPNTLQAPLSLRILVFIILILFIRQEFLSREGEKGKGHLWGWPEACRYRRRGELYPKL